MSEQWDTANIRELQWLANYYESHGHKSEAEEIKRVLSSRLFQQSKSTDVIQLFPSEQKKA